MGEVSRLRRDCAIRRATRTPQTHDPESPYAHEVHTKPRTALQSNLATTRRWPQPLTMNRIHEGETTRARPKRVQAPRKRHPRRTQVTTTKDLRSRVPCKV